MKIYALKALLSLRESELKEVTSIEVRAIPTPNTSHEKVAKFKRKFLNLVLRRQSRYQLIYAKLAQLPNVQELTLHFGLLGLLTDKEFSDFSNAIARQHNLQTLAFIINNSIYNSTISKRLLSLRGTLANLPKLQTINFYYEANAYGRIYRLDENLWKVASQCQALQNIGLHFKAIEQVNVGQLQVIGDGFAFYNKLNHIHVKALGINRLNNEQVEALGDIIAQAQTVTSVHLSLNLGQARVEQRRILSLCLKKLPHLKHLDASTNNIFGHLEQEKDISEGTTNLVNLSSINISTNNLGSFNPRHWQTIGTAFANLPYLEELDFSSNNLADMDSEQMHALGNAFAGLDKLKKLNLSINAFGSMRKDIWQAFLHALSKLQNLEDLDLSSIDLNCLDSEQWQSLGEVLAKLPKLKHLNFSSNGLGKIAPANFQAFIKAIKKISGLQTINLDDNLLSSQQLIQIISNVPPKVDKVSFVGSEFKEQAILKLAKYQPKWHYNPTNNELLKIIPLEDIEPQGKIIQEFCTQIFSKLAANSSLDKINQQMLAFLTTQNFSVLEAACKPKLKV